MSEELTWGLAQQLLKVVKEFGATEGEAKAALGAALAVAPVAQMKSAATLEIQT